MSGLCDLDLAELDGPTGFDLKGDGGAYDQGTAAETSPGSSRRVRTRGKRPKYRKASSSDGTDGGAGVARLRAALAALPGPAKQHAITADRVRAVYAAGRAAEARLLLAHAAPATVRLCAAPAPGRRLAAPAAAASDGAADKLDEATEKRLAALAAPLCPARPAPAPVAAPTAASTAAATAAATGPAAALVGRLRRRVALPEHGPLARRRRAAAAAAGGLVATLGALLLALVLAPAAGRAGPLGGMPLWSPPPPPPPKCVWSWSAGCVADDGTSGVCELSGLMSCQARPV